MATGLHVRRNAGRARKAAVACVSILVMLSAAVYLVAPIRTALAVQVSVDQTTAVPPGSEVIYGRATDLSGKAVSGVHICIAPTRWRDQSCAVVLVSGQDGTYWQQVKLASGDYLFTVDGPDHGRNGHRKMAHTQVHLEPGKAYRVSVEQRRRGVFTFLPVSSY